MAILKPSRLGLFPLILAREKLTRAGRQRVVGGEPAVMEDQQEVLEYDQCGAEAEVGLHRFSARAISRLLPEGGTLLDLGCGSGRLVARLARGRPDIRIVGLDLSDPMLELARGHMESGRLSDRVELRRADITAFEAEVPDGVDVISCNFAIHHLPETEMTKRCFETIGRTRSATGCGIWLFDFARLRNRRTWPAMTSMISWPGPAVLSDAIHSEESAFSFEEMTQLLDKAGLGDLEHVRSRPLGEYQAHWAPGKDRPYPVTGLWQEEPLSRETRLLARTVDLSFPRSLTRV
jgi:SAM-dependent methyltransferase